ncbi:NAD(P)H-dependent oxidoreductase [Sphingomonas sp.]|uniref:NADPH-dependent FMN reductase n=1 Tax=Sphingomonas sp. TaxID=28214 RepID=UPI001AFD61D2|nr:NAD(P)H-dependent oxidoreductase [Sphingomonas sp.]MBO9713426.1 NAD(P)H-dependent oxidoreductase [Sphingomonas sp.]
MSDSLRIPILLGSVREGRMAEPVGHWVHEAAAAHPGLACEIVDLKAWNLPFYAYPKPPAAGHYADPLQQRWAETIAAADGFILIAPEYNHGPSAVLKNALDTVYAEWNRKPCAFVSYGGVGGARAVEQLTCTARELQMAPIEAAVHLMGVWGKVHDGRFAPDERDARALDKLFTELLWWGQALKAAREG